MDDDDSFESERLLLTEEDVLVVVSLHEIENIAIQKLLSFAVLVSVNYISICQAIARTGEPSRPVNASGRKEH